MGNAIWYFGKLFISLNITILKIITFGTFSWEDRTYFGPTIPPMSENNIN